MTELFKLTDFEQYPKHPYFQAFLNFFSLVNNGEYSNAFNAGLVFYIKERNRLKIPPPYCSVFSQQEIPKIFSLFGFPFDPEKIFWGNLTYNYEPCCIDKKQAEKVSYILRLSRYSLNTSQKPTIIKLFLSRYFEGSKQMFIVDQPEVENPPQNN